MENFILYLIRTSIALAAFYLAYLLLFKKGKHFLFNRVYLTGSMLISFLIPLITFYVDAPHQPLMVDLPATQLQTELNADINLLGQILNWQLIAGLIFISGFLGFLFRLIAGHLKAHTIIKRTEKEILNDIHFRVSDEDIHPFSYFNQIVIPSDILKRSYLNVILQHEQVHVKEQHTIDVCIAELLFLFQWFNPFAWLLKDAIKDNLEFLTDDRIIRHADRQSYQLAMVMLVGKSGVPPFLTALNGSQLKNRIIMMKTKNQNKGQLTRKLLLLPLLTLLIITLSNREFKAQIPSQESKTVSGKVTSKETGKPIPTVAVVVKGKLVGTITDAEGNYIIKLEADDSSLVFSFPGYEKQEIALNNRTQIDVQLQKSPGTTHLSVKGYAGHPEIKKAEGSLKDTAAAPIQNRTMIRDNKSGSKDTLYPLFIIDGVKMGRSSGDQLLPPSDQIESISVLKQDKGIEQYGVDGKEGVIIITTKKKK
jgi:uncharacterized protein (UPF0333 family)